jgi:hypothetical protein
MADGRVTRAALETALVAVMAAVGPATPEALLLAMRLDCTTEWNEMMDRFEGMLAGGASLAQVLTLFESQRPGCMQH